MIGFVKRKKKDPKEELKDFLGGYELPTFSGIIMNILSLLRENDIKMEKIAKKIKVDPGLTIRILKIVNSASFGLRSKVASIEHAVTILGKSRLEAIVISLAVKDSVPEVDPKVHNSSKFWLSSVRRAFLAEAIAKVLHPHTQTESFTAGLLQDMAIPVLTQLKRDQYCDLLNQWTYNQVEDLVILERNTFGVDHQVIGALMAEQWGLPADLIKSIRSHHCYSVNNEVEPAVCIVSLLKNFSEEIEEMMNHINDNYGIPHTTAKEMVKRSFDNAEEFASLLS
jgi:HD-like signal output (HDOD) protein